MHGKSGDRDKGPNGPFLLGEVNMRIKYRANGSEREVDDGVGKILIDRKIATRVHKTRAVVAEEPVEISERTGKPKRQYKRRDMQASEE